MGRLILLVIVGLAAALYFPDSRQYLKDKAMPLMDPVLKWQTADEMDQIVRDLRTYEQEHANRLPEQEEWLTFLERSYGGQTTDSWGSQYHYMVQRDSFIIVSYGPDRVYGTEDDIRNGGLRAMQRR